MNCSTIQQTTSIFNRLPIYGNRWTLAGRTRHSSIKLEYFPPTDDKFIATDGKSVSEICDEIVSELIAYDLRLNKKES